MQTKAESDIILVDLDHTLSDARWRDHLINEKMTYSCWDKYHEECGYDPVFEPVAAVVRALRLCGAHVYIVTARPNSVRSKTEAWLSKHNINVDALIMRDNFDRTSSAKLKVKQIMHMMPINMLARVKLIIDDREDVIEEFSKIGICGLRVVMS